MENIYSGYLDVGKEILKRMLQKYGMKVWTELVQDETFVSAVERSQLMFSTARPVPFSLRVGS
jgi:hypothetical protein